MHQSSDITVLILIYHESIANALVKLHSNRQLVRLYNLVPISCNQSYFLHTIPLTDNVYSKLGILFLAPHVECVHGVILAFLDMYIHQITQYFKREN